MSDNSKHGHSGDTDLARLACAYLDLWQDHAALTASDPKIAEQWQQMFSGLAKAANGAVEDTGGAE